MNRISQVGDTNISSEGGGGTTYNTNNRLNAAFIGNGNVSSTAFSQINQLIQNQTAFQQTLISMVFTSFPNHLSVGDLSAGNVWTIVPSGGGFKGSWVAPTSRSISDFTCGRIGGLAGVYEVNLSTALPSGASYVLSLTPRMSSHLNYNQNATPIVVCNHYYKSNGKFKVRIRWMASNNDYEGTLTNNEFDFIVVYNNEIYCSGTVLADGTKGT